MLVDDLIKKQKRFVLLYIFILLIVFSPSKALGQFAPIIFILGTIFFVNINAYKNIRKLALIGLVYFVIGLVYYCFYPKFSFINFYFFFVTFSSFLIPFINFRKLIDKPLLVKLGSITTWIVLFEALYGLMQAIYNGIRQGGFDLSNGDNVRGTIELSFTTQGLGGNVIYVILISCLFVQILSLQSTKFKLKNLFVYALILLAWVMASVLHTLIFFGLALLISLIIYKMPHDINLYFAAFNKIRNRLFLVLAALAVITYLFLPKNLSLIPNYLRFISTITPTAYSEKSVAIFYTLFSLPKDAPIQPFIGLGPGQYSSRASLILTGEYLKGTSVPLPFYKSPATKKYILPLWERSLSRPGMGSTYFPFFSWMSLYGEMGFVGLFFGFLIILRGITFFTKNPSKEFPLMTIGMITLILYVAFLGVQDNYWEFTQAIFPGILTIKICYDYLYNENKLVAK